MKQEQPLTSVAVRVHTTLREFQNFRHNRPLIEGLTTLFHLKPSDPSHPYLVGVEAGRRLSLLDSQLVLLQERLLTELPKLDEVQVEGSINRLHHFLASCANGLQSQWQGLKGLLSQDLLTQLDMWQQLLERDEHQIDSTELANLSSELDSFLSALSSHSNPVLRRVLREVVNAIRRAIADYEVSGEAGMQSAIRDALSAIAKNRDILKSDDPAIIELGVLWHRFVQVCEPVIVCDALYSAYEHGKPIVAAMLEFMPG